VAGNDHLEETIDQFVLDSTQELGYLVGSNWSDVLPTSELDCKSEANAILVECWDWLFEQ
jgi:hypothetical protein